MNGDTIDKAITTWVNEKVSEFGSGGYVISSKEFITLIHERFEIDEGSILPGDYCYNRLNRGKPVRNMTKPRLLILRDDGDYECVGENHPYTGEVDAMPRELNRPIVIGFWKNGEFSKGSNWDEWLSGEIKG